MRRAFGKVMWVGRATVFMVGLAVMLAVVLGIATAALAGTGVGATFNLGQKNAVNRISSLVGSTDSAMLRVDNNNAGTNATALNLQVEPGHTPMRVNSTTQVDNLNADFLDGKSDSEFMPRSVYKTEAPTDKGKVLGDGSEVKSMSCDPGDTVLSGGPASVNAGSKVLDSFPTDTRTWNARIFPVEGGDDFTVVILCANNQ